MVKVWSVLVAAVASVCVLSPGQGADLGRGAKPETPASGSRGGGPATLAEVVEATVNRFPQQQVLQARGAEVSAIEEKARSLIAGPPSVYGLYRSDALGSDQGLREFEADLEVPLWRPGERGAAARVGEVQRNGLEQSRAAMGLEVAGQVREAIWEVTFARNELQLAKKEWETALALEKDVEKRAAAGEMAKTDLLLAREETLRKETAHLTAKAEVEHSTIRYRTLTGFEQLPQRAEETRSTVKEITGNHPLLSESNGKVEEARARVNLSMRSAGGNPDLLVGAKRERGSAADDYDNSVQIAVRVPLNLGPHSKPDVAAANRGLAEADADRASLLRRLENELHTAGHELETTEQRLRLAQEQNKIARENLRLARVAFSAGEADLVSLQRVQGLAFAAERAEQQLRILRQRAIARYNQAAGVLP